jgi:hypothetical protein
LNAFRLRFDSPLDPSNNVKDVWPKPVHGVNKASQSYCQEALDDVRERDSLEHERVGTDGLRGSRLEKYPIPVECATEAVEGESYAPNFHRHGKQLFGIHDLMMRRFVILNFHEDDPVIS